MSLWLRTTMALLVGALVACYSPDAGTGATNLDEGGAVAGDGRPDVIVPPGCVLTSTLKDSPVCVDGSVAVFVAPSGDDGATGSKRGFGAGGQPGAGPGAVGNAGGSGAEGKAQNTLAL